MIIRLRAPRACVDNCIAPSLWVCDNLLDPSHVAWVHVGSFAGAGTDDEPLNVEKTDRGVIVSRWIAGKPPSPYYAKLVAFDVFHALISSLNVFRLSSMCVHVVTPNFCRSPVNAGV